MSTVSRAACRVLPLALPLALACTGETLGPPLPDQSTVYWDLHLNHHAVTLSTTAPYDTLSLVATPRNIRGEPLTGLPAVQYVSRDPERVRVTPGGVLVAISPTVQVVIVATLTTGNLKHKDSLFVRVVADPAPPVLATFSVHPLPPDSAKYGALRFANPAQKKLPVQATDTAGAPMANPLVSFRSSDPAIASIHELTGVISNPLGGLPGEVKIYAEMTAFGVAKVDTVRYRIGLPIDTYVMFRPRPDGLPGSIIDEKELRVGVGAAVFFRGFTGDPRVEIDIVFSDPTHVAGFVGSSVVPFAPLSNSLCGSFKPRGLADCTNGGNIMMPLGQNTNGSPQLGIAARVFPVPGIYDFHSTLNSAVQGRIVVIDESE